LFWCLRGFIGEVVTVLGALCTAIMSVAICADVIGTVLTPALINDSIDVDGCVDFRGMYWLPESSIVVVCVVLGG